MAVKLVWQYNEFNQGFADVWYKAGDAFKEATVFTGAQVGAIMAFRDPNLVLNTIRGSLIGSPRNSYLNIYTTSHLPNPGEELDPDIAASCALIRLYTASGLSRNWWCRGMPDQYIVRGHVSGRSIPSAGFNAALQNFNNLLPNMGVCTQQQDGPAINPPQVIQRMEPDTIFNTSTRVTLAAGSTAPPANSRVLFTGITPQMLPYFRSTYKMISRIDALTFVIRYNWLSAAAAIFPSYATARRQTYSYPQLIEAKFIRFATRDTGRPTVPSRGRRAGVRLR